MAYKKPPTFETLELSKLFIDAVQEEISCGNVRRQHGTRGNGYQRDPFVRQQWIDKRVPKFDNLLLRPLEVSKRGDGSYAIIDGGGRWLLAQKAKKHAVACRVHEGLTREQEAELFFKFDREIYRLRAVDVYLAALAAGHPEIVEINKAITPPYRITKSGGASGFDGVGTLYDIYFSRGTNLIRKTALAVANTWGGLKKSGTFEGARVSGSQFGAVALVLDTYPKIEPALRAVLNRTDYSPAKLAQKIEKRLGGEVKGKTIERLSLGASILAQRANAESREGEKVDLRDLRASPLLEAFERQAGAKQAFGSRVAEDAAEKAA
jgi:hypothetical protein